MKDLALESIKLLPKQAKQAWKETSKLKFPKKYKRVKNIIIAGMGGSAYSYYVINSLYQKSLKIPLVLSNDYNLPDFVNKDTLVITSSFSGNTEETISSAKQAIKRKAKVTAITSGGKLGQLMKKYKLSYYEFNPKYNPSNQPRMGQGYMLLGTLGILENLGILEKINLYQCINSLMQNKEKVKKEANKLVNFLKEKIIVYVAAEHLSGNAHIIRNQTNETAKNFAVYSLIPELNHHLMEGLKKPKNKNLIFMFLNSYSYSLKIKKRMALTKEVVRKNKIKTIEYKVKKAKKLTEILEVLMFGGYLTYFLANKYDVDPNKILWVDYFKKKLAS